MPQQNIRPMLPLLHNCNLNKTPGFFGVYYCMNFCIHKYLEGAENTVICYPIRLTSYESKKNLYELLKN